MGGTGKVLRPQGIGRHHYAVQLYACLLDAAAEYILMLMGRGVDAGMAGDLHHMLWFSRQQRLGCHGASLIVVCPDDGNTVVDESVKCHNGQVNIPVAFQMQGMGSYNQPVHGVAAQHIQKDQLGVFLFAGGANHGLVAVAVQGDFDFVQQGCKERVGYVRDDNTDDIGAVQGQVPCHLAGHIIQLLHGSLDLGPGGL